MHRRIGPNEHDDRRFLVSLRDNSRRADGGVLQPLGEEFRQEFGLVGLREYQYVDSRAFRQALPKEDLGQLIAKGVEERADAQCDEYGFRPLAFVSDREEDPFILPEVNDLNEVIARAMANDQSIEITDTQRRQSQKILRGKLTMFAESKDGQEKQ